MATDRCQPEYKRNSMSLEPVMTAFQQQQEENNQVSVWCSRWSMASRENVKAEAAINGYMGQKASGHLC